MGVLWLTTDRKVLTPHMKPPQGPQLSRVAVHMGGRSGTHLGPRPRPRTPESGTRPPSAGCMALSHPTHSRLREGKSEAGRQLPSSLESGDEPWKETLGPHGSAMDADQVLEFCEEEAGRRGNEEEFTTWRRHRREKPSAQVSKNQGEREPEREQGPQRLWDLSTGSQAGGKGERALGRKGAGSPGEEGRATEDSRQPLQQPSKDQIMLCKRESTTPPETQR